MQLGGTHEKLETSKSSHILFAGPHGHDAREASLANEGRLCRSLQLPSVLSLLFQQACRAPALRVQHGGKSPPKALGGHELGGGQVLADRGPSPQGGDETKRAGGCPGGLSTH